VIGPGAFFISPTHAVSQALEQVTNTVKVIALDFQQVIFERATAWGAPRMLSELLLLGHNGAEVTVAKYTSCELYWKGQ
jgi:hypothetical protein